MYYDDAKFCWYMEFSYFQECSSDSEIQFIVESYIVITMLIQGYTNIV